MIINSVQKHVTEYQIIRYKSHTHACRIHYITRSVIHQCEAKTLRVTLVDCTHTYQFPGQKQFYETRRADLWLWLFKKSITGIRELLVDVSEAFTNRSCVKVL